MCKDFIQARGVLESLMAKGEASLVNLRRETISLSDAAEKKHGEFRDVQKSEMLRLRDETRLSVGDERAERIRALAEKCFCRAPQSTHH